MCQEMTTEPSPITLLLHRARGGDYAARDELMNIVYAELHRLAKNELRRDWSCHTLQPTALVNEAFLKLFGAPTPAFHDRSHFLGIMAHVMRQVLVDHARARRAQKRGRGLQVPLDQAAGARQPAIADLLAVNEALDLLGREDSRLLTLVEMRFFGGMTAEETADAIGESVNVVRHDLRYAQAWLRRTLDSRAPE
jgi:RNA polymerase sigma-70 factor, ECF subfamily